MEQWIDIEGFEGIYQVSSHGRVKALAKEVNNRYGLHLRREVILKPHLINSGYLMVSLYTAPKVKKAYTIHTLVACAFHGHVTDGMNTVVDHMDDNKLNNRADNLQIITHRKNCSRSRKDGSSRYTGVSWKKSHSKWEVGIQIQGKRKHLGLFEDELDAANAYQQKLKELV